MKNLFMNIKELLSTSKVAQSATLISLSVFLALSSTVFYYLQYYLAFLTFFISSFFCYRFSKKVFDSREQVKDQDPIHIERMAKMERRRSARIEKVNNIISYCGMFLFAVFILYSFYSKSFQWILFCLSLAMFFMPIIFSAITQSSGFALQELNKIKKAQLDAELKRIESQASQEKVRANIELKKIEAQNETNRIEQEKINTFKTEQRRKAEALEDFRNRLRDRVS